MKIGRPADEPRIISLLRTVLTPALGWGGMDPVTLRNAYVELGEIVKLWAKSEDMNELQRVLGVTRSRRGQPRTSRAVRAEQAIVESMLAAAREGIDVSAYSKAADALTDKGHHVDEKKIERAWNAWGEWLTLGVRRNKAALDSRRKELRSHFAAEAASAVEQFPHLAPLINTPEAIDRRVEELCTGASKFAADVAALALLPPLNDIK